MIVVHVNTHWLTKWDFRYDVIISRYVNAYIAQRELTNVNVSCQCRSMTGGRVVVCSTFTVDCGTRPVNPDPAVPDPLVDSYLLPWLLLRLLQHSIGTTTDITVAQWFVFRKQIVLTYHFCKLILSRLMNGLDFVQRS